MWKDEKIRSQIKTEILDEYDDGWVGGDLEAEIRDEIKQEVYAKEQESLREKVFAQLKEEMTSSRDTRRELVEDFRSKRREVLNTMIETDEQYVLWMQTYTELKDEACWDMEDTAGLHLIKDFVSEHIQENQQKPASLKRKLSHAA